jgi:hypothetical protein
MYKMSEDRFDAARRAKKRVAEAMPAGVEVIGVGIGLSGSVPALKVNLKAPSVDERTLPATIEGVPVVYDILGKIRAQ